MPVVIVSGCHSGPNPSPGVGTAHSLRKAFPSAHLIGRDFSALSSGLHDPVFDEAWIAGRWGDVDLDAQWSLLLARLESAWLISGLDLEVTWLADRGHARVLCPPRAALVATAKPTIPAAADLPVRLPKSLALAAGDRELHRFCRRNDWRVWVKGPAHEAILATSWSEFQSAARALEATWGVGLFVQADVRGQGMSVALTALRGELLDAVMLEKHATTPEGKVWSGSVHPVPAEIAEPLQGVLRKLDWTGGGELEFIRDGTGKLWLIEWNPRFPAWVHGATLAGHNLPGLLLRAATDEGPEQRDAVPSPMSTAFARIVVEVPVRRDLPLPQPTVPFPEQTVPGAKHPSGMPQLSRRLGRAEPQTAPEELDAEVQQDLAEVTCTDTPQRLHLRRTAEQAFARMREAAESLGIAVAYSIKTNPGTVFAALSRRSGFLAEAISPGEVAWAVEQGWKASDIVYNGPLPIPVWMKVIPLGSAFADSLAAFRQYAERRVARVVGIRVRPPDYRSRFGIDVDVPEEFQRAAAAIQQLPKDVRFGLSFHAPGSEIGMARWEQLCRSVIDFGRALEELTGRSVSMLNLGGGAAPTDFEIYIPAVERLATQARGVFPHLESVLIEPGKVLVQSAEALVSRVVEVRTLPTSEREVVVDAGIGDLPMTRVFPHRVARVLGDRAVLFGRGPDRILGRTCMEQDVLAAGVDLPADLAVGDVIAFCDAGAYDASMAYDFGTGVSRESAARIVL